MTNNVPIVSVIIPTYNRAKFLSCAVESVLKQTFRNFELIIVDDGSRDNTQEVVSRYEDKRIKYVKHEINRGLNFARNTGISYSRGKFIAFLDSDDEWMVRKLEKQLKIFRESNCKNLGVVYVGMKLIFAEGKAKYVIPKKRGDISEFQLRNDGVRGGSNALVCKKIFEKEGNFDESKYLWGGWDDVEMWIRAAKNWNFDFSEEVLFKMHKHKTSRSSTIIQKNPEKAIEALLYVLDKHKDLYAKYALARTKMFRNIATFCIMGNNKKKAIIFLIKAIRSCPFFLRNYVNLIVCLISSNLYKKILYDRRGIRQCLNNNS